MPRNSSGTYTLPAGNPVAANTVIETAWANPTMNDLASGLTDSLDRYGRGTMLAAMKLSDGAQASPSLTFNSETSSGLYRANSHDIRFSVAGVDLLKMTDAGVAMPVGFVGNLALSKGSIITGGGSTSGTWQLGANSAVGNLELLVNAATGNTAGFDYNPMVADGTSAATMRLFRSTTTTGTRSLQILRGDGTNTVDHRFYGQAPGDATAGKVGVELSRNGTRTLIGTTSDNTIDLLQVAISARVRNGASGVPTNAAAAPGYDEFVIEGSGAVGMSFLSPNNVNCGIAWGDPQALGQGYVLYNHSVDQMQFGVNATTNLILDKDYTRSTVPVYVPDGTAAAPTLAFMTQATWGIFRVPAIGIGFTVSGVEVARLMAAGMQFSAGNTNITHNDTTTYIGMFGGTATDGISALVLYDTGHATLPRYANLRGRGIIFSDAAVANEKARFTASTTTGELLVNGTSTGTLSTTNRGLVTADGSLGGIFGVLYGGARVGYIYSFSATEFRISTGAAAMAMTFCQNATEVFRIDTDNTLQYGGFEVGYRDLNSTTKTTNYTITSADRGKSIRADAPVTLINCPGTMPAGSVVNIYNNTGGNISIGAVSSGTFRWGTGTPITTTPRTLAHSGLVTAYWLTATVIILTGTGIS